MFGCSVPIGPATTPPSRWFAAWFTIAATLASNSDTLTWRPRPVRARSCEGGQDADRGLEAGDDVEQRDAGLHGLPARLAGHAHQARQRLHDDVVAGTVRPSGTSSSKAVSEQVMRRGFAAPQVLERRARARAMSPGRKFSITTSEPAARRRTASAPSAVFRSSATDRLFRLSDRKYAASSPTNGGPQWRVSSPCAGPFDLDHVGAEIAQDLRRQRAGEHPREVEDAQPRAGERAVVHGRRAYPA